jgi:hypothetical protein
VNMMERHYCAHPVIPGYPTPDPRAIKRWAVFVSSMNYQRYGLTLGKTGIERVDGSYGHVRLTT